MLNPHLCPACSAGTKVSDSRMKKFGWGRRRTCVNCGFRFSTFEITEDEMIEHAVYLKSENRRLKLLIRSIVDLAGEVKNV